jgi:V8-like Glu-specific endopeptidase
MECGMRRLFAGIILCLWPFGLGAQDSTLVSLQTADATRGWEGVGRIDIAGRAFCTGAMIAPDIVLTAAHCLFDSETQKPFAANDFKFLAGWRNGRAVAYRGVKRVLAHPDYRYLGPEHIEEVGRDLALLELDQPIRLASIQPFAIGSDALLGETVEVVSYALDRSEAPSLQRSCSVLAPVPGMTVFSCSVDFGSSGAPIFRVKDGVPQIVSVVSAKAEMKGIKVSLGVRMTEPLAELRAAFDQSQDRFRKIVPGTNSLPQIKSSTVGASATAGAKFLKPAGP